MFWCLDLDDFTGKFCNKGKYPLISAVAKELGGYTPPPQPTGGPKPPTKRPSKTERPPRTERPRTERPRTKRPTGGNGKCHAIGVWKGNANMDAWCHSNCRRGNCPEEVCEC